METPVKMEKKRKNRKRKLSEAADGINDSLKQTKPVSNDVEMEDQSGKWRLLSTSNDGRFDLNCFLRI